jgi:CBS domain-containing protein
MSASRIPPLSALPHLARETGSRRSFRKSAPVQKQKERQPSDEFSEAASQPDEVTTKTEQPEHREVVADSGRKEPATKARAVMSRDVVWVPPEAKLEEVYVLMQRMRIRHVPVMKGDRLVGILSDRDVLLRARRLADGEVRVPVLTASEAMTKSPVTCSPEATVSNVAALMIKHKIDCLPIVSLGRILVGVVTSTDLLELLRGPEQESLPLPFQFVLRHSTEIAA